MIDFWIFPLSTIWGAYHFRHFARYMSFTPIGKQGKKKQIMNGIEVSVVLHLV